MRSKHYVIGIDGGGTKTACMLVDMEGSAVACSTVGGSNHQIDGLSAAMENVCQAIDDVCGQIGVKREEIGFVFLGMAGADMQEDFALLRSGLKRALGEIPFEVVNDLWIVFSSAAEDDWGAVSICGTGSNMAVKTREGKLYSVRALRYTLGNYGGGHHLAEIALHHAFRCEEGTGEYTRLVEELPALCQCKNMQELAMCIYNSNYRYYRDYNIPRMVFDLAEQGDAVCLRIIEEMGQEMGEMLGRLIIRSGMEKLPVPVVLAGSQYAKDEKGLLLRPFVEVLKTYVPDARIRLAEDPPVFGAVMDAAAALGKRLPEETRENLRLVARQTFS